MWLLGNVLSLAVTTDLEWCSEEQIRRLFDLADDYHVPLFPFVTHRSVFLGKRGGPQGIHPNFLPGSTHGQTEEEVLDHCFKLVPNAQAFRAHCFYSHSRLLWAMAERGIKADANLLSYLSWTVPFRNVGGFLTFPTYWSDDVAIRNGATELPKRRLNSIHPLIVNVHPKNAGLPMVEELFRYARARSVPFESLYQ